MGAGGYLVIAVVGAILFVAGVLVSKKINSKNTRADKMQNIFEEYMKKMDDLRK